MCLRTMECGPAAPVEESALPIATPEIYSEIIERAKAGGFAFLADSPSWKPWRQEAGSGRTGAELPCGACLPATASPVLDDAGAVQGGYA